MLDNQLTRLKSRLHSLGWFLVVNTLLAIVVGLRYFAYMPVPADLLTWFYTCMALIGQMALLALLASLLASPLLLIPQQLLRNCLLAFYASLAIGLLYIDTIVFAQYRFHINAVVLELVFAADVVEFPIEAWLTLSAGLSLLLAAEYLLCRYLDKPPRWLATVKFSAFAKTFFIAVLLTHGIHMWAAANAKQSITNVTPFLPFFYPTLANNELRKLGLVDEEAVKRSRKMQLSEAGTLNYPLHPLSKKAVENPVNILLIVVDSWRFESFSKRYSPNIWQFAEQHGQTYDQHLSTGNATRTGIFGLFYGIPGTYWHSFLSNRRSPVLMDRLQELNYNLGIFASAQLTAPEFSETVFVKVPNLRLKTDAPSGPLRDQKITEEWLQWQNNRDKSVPAFSFLFYDTPHAYVFPEDYPVRFEPMIAQMNYLELHNDYDPTPILNRYYTSVHFVDSEIAKILAKVKADGELENTLVIITGDHGQELNDNKLNYWGHNSNYTDAQVKVPFILAGVGIDKYNPWRQLSAMTSHEDVVPTLMKNYLGVTSDSGDYSTGLDLLANAQLRDWLLCAKYSGYGIISRDGIVDVAASTGSYQLLDRHNRPRKGEAKATRLQQAFAAMSRFMY